MSNNDIVSGFDDEQDDGLTITLRKIEELDGGLLLSLTGYIEKHNQDWFLRRVTKAIDAGFIRLVFDMSGLLWGTMGIGTFTLFLKALKYRGGDLVIINIQPGVPDALQLLGFPQFFNIRDTLDEAIAFFSGKSEAVPTGNDAIVPGFDDEQDDGLTITLRKIEELDGGLLLSLNGYIEGHNSNWFQRRVTKAINAGFIRLVFDMSGLHLGADWGIGAFTSFLKAVKLRGGDVVMIKMQPNVYEVFQLLGFSQFFKIKIRDSLSEAVAFFSGKPEAAAEGGHVGAE
jgi:anti-sigma B factor antagonist